MPSMYILTLYRIVLPVGKTNFKHKYLSVETARSNRAQFYGLART